MRLDGIQMPENVTMPELYWHYEKHSEKMADILLHMQTMYHGMYCVYENHAGCERGYFRTNLLHAEVIDRINEIPNVYYKGMKIWSDESTKLYPYGYPFCFVANQIHQYILVFRKEK